MKHSFLLLLFSSFVHPELTEPFQFARNLLPPLRTRPTAQRGPQPVIFTENTFALTGNSSRDIGSLPNTPIGRRFQHAVFAFGATSFSFVVNASGARASLLKSYEMAKDQVAPGVVPISIPKVLLSMTPLLLIALVSKNMGLDLETSIVTGAFRTLVQLSILGSILRPIFLLKNIYLVICYCLMMIFLASNVACGKSKYMFPGQFDSVLASILASVACTSIFAFGAIIRPRPLWHPQYVIPMVGMLLGNSVNGIAITMNSLCIALVEQQREIELYLTFGATHLEAISRLLREAVRSGTMPILNNMAVIGIISIPGMMTGQILGGSPVMQAARYQTMIMYLIATATFGAILLQIGVILEIGFDHSSQMLRADRFEKVPESLSFWYMAKNSLFVAFLTRKCGFATQQQSTLDPLTQPYDATNHGTIRTSVLVESLNEVASSTPDDACESKNALKMMELAKTIGMVNRIPKDATSDSLPESSTRMLFHNLSFQVKSGEIYLVDGPSGSGKSQLLRSIAMLSPLNAGVMELDGTPLGSFSCPSDWRKRVRYVTQYKVDIHGSPKDFVNRVTNFKSWKRQNELLSESAMLESVTELVEEWGLPATCLDKEWSSLSGGEAQRVVLAIALASKPSVLLLDESTSALDLSAKIAVERTVDEFTEKYGLKTIWVSHDPAMRHRYEN